MEYAILGASIAIFCGMLVHNAYIHYKARKKWQEHMKHRLDDS